MFCISKSHNATEFLPLNIHNAITPLILYVQKHIDKHKNFKLLGLRYPEHLTVLWNKIRSFLFCMSSHWYACVSPLGYFTGNILCACYMLTLICVDAGFSQWKSLEKRIIIWSYCHTTGLSAGRVTTIPDQWWAPEWSYFHQWERKFSLEKFSENSSVFRYGYKLQLIQALRPNEFCYSGSVCFGKTGPVHVFLGGDGGGGVSRPAVVLLTFQRLVPVYFLFTRMSVRKQKATGMRGGRDCCDWATYRDRVVGHAETRRWA